MALDHLLDLFAHRILIIIIVIIIQNLYSAIMPLGGYKGVLVLYFLCFSYSYVQQTKLASSLVNFWAHDNIVFD